MNPWKLSGSWGALLKSSRGASEVSCYRTTDGRAYGYPGALKGSIRSASALALCAGGNSEDS